MLEQSLFVYSLGFDGQKSFSGAAIRWMVAVYLWGIEKRTTFSVA